MTLVLEYPGPVTIAGQVQVLLGHAHSFAQPVQFVEM